jgi:DNA-binding transcriptional LysR family regulator
METGWLEVFREVARLGSFTAAGQAMGFTQSAISGQISTLEAEVGAPLFDRLPPGVRLTEQGRCLLPHAEGVLDRLAAARRELTQLREPTSGRVRVGTFPTADASLMPRALAAFRATHPDVSVFLQEGLTATLMGHLRAGDLDLAVVGGSTDGPLDAELVDLRPLMDDPMLVALPGDHPLANRRKVRLAELAGDRWIAGSPRVEETLVSAFTRQGFRPEIESVIGAWIAKQGFVAAGLGVTLIPSLAAGTVRSDIALASLHPDDVPIRTVYAATPKGRAEPPAVAAFLDRLDDAVTELRTTLAERSS